MNVPPMLLRIQQLHQLYCRLTNQKLRLRFDRERLWLDFIRAGFTPAELSRVIAYLQKEIRHSRRNVGALKLSNLLQLDRFEEDLNISRVRLFPKSRPTPQTRPTQPACSLAEQEQGRRRAVQALRELQEKLRRSDL